MPWLVIRLRHLLCSCQSCPIPPLSSFPSPPLTSFSLPWSRKELHALSFHKSLPFLLPMPWLVIRLRQLLCSCQSCSIPSRRFPLPALPALPSPFPYTCSPALPSPPFPPPPLTSLSSFPARGKNYMRPFCCPCPGWSSGCAIYCPCPGWSSGCAIYSAAVSPAQSPPAVSLYLVSRLSPLLLSLHQF